jgi:hypothetical protein
MLKFDNTNEAVSKLVDEFHSLRLFLVQDQQARNKSPIPKRPIAQKLVQFVTCHGCGKKPGCHFGHFSGKSSPKNIVTASGRHGGW